MPKIFSIGQMNTGKNGRTSYIAKSVAVSAGLGACVQGVYDLGYYLKNSKAIKEAGSSSAYLKSMPKSALYSAGCSALLGAVLSGAYILIDKIKNSKSNTTKVN